MQGWRKREVLERISRGYRQHQANRSDCLGGDLNGHVGAEQEEYERWHEGKSLGERNEGNMILEMVKANDLGLVNTFFTKSPEQTCTYKTNQNRTVIDYIAIRRNVSGNVINCKVIPGEPMTSQHWLVVMYLKIIEKRRIKRIHTKRIHWWKLKTEEINFS